MKTKHFLIASLVFTGLLFTACQKDKELAPEETWVQSGVTDDEKDPAFIDFGGSSDIIDEIEIMNYPNPFVHSTTIVYYLNKVTFVRLNVIEVNGGRATLLFEGHQPPGRHSAVFNAKGQLPGEYIAELYTDAYTAKEVMFKVEEELGDVKGRH